MTDVSGLYPSYTTFDEGYRLETSVIFILPGTRIFLVFFLSNQLVVRLIVHYAPAFQHSSDYICCPENYLSLPTPPLSVVSYLYDFIFSFKNLLLQVNTARWGFQSPPIITQPGGSRVFVPKVNNKVQAKVQADTNAYLIFQSSQLPRQSIHQQIGSSELCLQAANIILLAIRLFYSQRHASQIWEPVQVCFLRKGRSAIQAK